MRGLKTKPPRLRGRAAAPKRGSASWRAGTAVRRFWLSPLRKIIFFGGIFFIFPALLWWAEYPQRLGAFVSHSAIAATGRMGFCLSDVLVEGRRHTPIDKILKVVNLRCGDPLLAYDPYQIKKKLEEISWIRQATVKRQLPGIIFIQLHERQPVALWQHQRRRYLVDDQGVIISSDNLGAFDKLPIIVGGDAPVHAPHILRLLEKFPDLRKRLTALVRVGGRRWDVHLDGTLHIKLPENKVEGALVRLDLLIKQKKANPAEVKIVDLRVENQIVMRLSPGAAMRLKGKGKET